MRLVLFGDTLGLPQLLRGVRQDHVKALVGAAVRPAQHGPLAKLAAELSVPFIVQPLQKAPGYIGFSASLADLEPDFFLVNSYAMLLRPDVLKLPQHGAVNLHGGLLPEQRGANPIEWTILRGDRRAGASLHWMDGGFDNGDLIDRYEVPIRFSDTWVDVRRKVTAATDRLIEEMLPRVLAGTAPRTPQDGTRANYFKRRHPEDGTFAWASPALDIYNLVRALVAPHPGARPDTPSRIGNGVFRTWRSLPEIIWMKSMATGGFRASGSSWRLLAHRPPLERDRQRANRHVTLGLCHWYDQEERATLVLSEIADWEAAEYRILPSGRRDRVASTVFHAAWHAVRDFASLELKGLPLIG